MKESLESGFSRKIYICLNHKCDRCSFDIKEVPKDCPYRILHALETDTCCIKAMPRKSGKTSKIVRMANKIASAGYPVYLITMNQSMGKHLQHIGRLDAKVVVISQHDSTRLHRYSAGYILFDEIMPEKVEEIMRQARGSSFVAAYFTPHL